MDATAELIIWSSGVLNGQLPSAVVTIPVKFHGYVGLSGWDGVTVFADAHRDAITAKLKTGWLKSAEEHITDNYGTTGKGRVLTIQFDYAANAEVNAVARMETTMSGNVSLRHTLKLYLKSFVPYEYKNTDGISYDRMIAHELVHGVFNDWVNQTQQPLWFVEGIAESIHGGLNRYNYHRTNGDTVNKIVNSLNPTRYFNYETYQEYFISNENTSIYYAAAYLAIRYLHNYLKPFGILRIFNRIKSGVSLDNAFNQTTPWATAQSFVDYFTDFNNDITSGSPGASWVQANIEGVNTFGDTGAIGGFLVDSGSVQYDTTIFDDNLTSEDQPLTGFIIDWQLPEIPEEETLATITEYAHAHRMMSNGASGFLEGPNYNDFYYQFVNSSYVFSESHIAFSELSSYLVGSASRVYLTIDNERAVFNLKEFSPAAQSVVGCVIYSSRTKLGVTQPLIFYIDLQQFDPLAFTQNTFSFSWINPPGTLTFGE